MNLKAVAAGALALVVLEVFVTSRAQVLTGVLALPASWARRLVDPTVPAIPDLTKH